MSIPKKEKGMGNRAPPRNTTPTAMTRRDIEPVKAHHSIPYFGPRRFDVDHLNIQFVQAVATCHNVSIINGELMGDPLELQMLRFTDWSIHNIANEVKEIEELERQQEEDARNYLDETTRTVLEQQQQQQPEVAVDPILSLYDFDERLPTIMKPPTVELSVTQLMRKGYTIADLQRVKQRWNEGTQSWRSIEEGLTNTQQKQKQLDLALRQYLPKGRSEMGILKQ